jgi:hypothetical protein
MVKSPLSLSLSLSLFLTLFMAVCYSKVVIEWVNNFKSVLLTTTSIPRFHLLKVVASHLRVRLGLAGRPPWHLVII